MKNSIYSIGLITTISACGASGGVSSDNVTTPDGDIGTSYSDLLLDFRSIGKDSARVAAEEGSTFILPSSGAATFSGVASFSEHAGPQIISNASLSVNFNDSSINGNFTNFRGDDGTIFNGAMTLLDGRINSSDSSITANLDGRLTSNSARMSTVDASGDFNGRFIGDNHRYVRGDTSAIWITNEGTGTEERINMQGELRTVKQY